MNQSILELEQIYKSFFGVSALSDVSFTLPKGKILGLVGENGAGKSTLMNIIGGVISPDRGKMRLDGKLYHPKNPADATGAGIAFIHQELNLFTNLSISENIFIDNFPKIAGLPLIDRRCMKTQTQKLLESIHLSLSPDTPVEKLSPGERQLVEIAKALSSNARIIIFDEPTTSLTAREMERLFDLILRLRDEGRSIIYISHILTDVMRLSDQILVLRDGRVTGSGSKEEFTTNRMITLMVGRDIKQLYPEPQNNPSTKKALELKAVSQSGIVHNIDFTLYEGEVLGIFGLMGSGRSELARILYGIDSCEKGTISIYGQILRRRSPRTTIRHGIAFVTENRREEGLLMEVPIMENLSLVALPRYTRSILKLVQKKKIHDESRKIVGTLRIKCATPERSPAKSLSGGNQQKVVLGKWLMANPSILIVDEPTRGIDVGAKYEVYSIINELAAKGKSVLLISSEIEELMGVCDRILVMSKGEITGTFPKEQFDREQILRSAFHQSES